MNLPELYVMRHGQTEWNVAGRWQGKLDSPLTKVGREQAHRLGEILRRHGAGPATYRIYCSPKGRARATAEIAIAGRGGTVIYDDRLQEIDVGDWTGKTRDEIYDTNPWITDETPFLDIYANAPKAESFDDLWNRVSGFLQDLTGPSLIFTHGITSRFLRAVATGRTLADLSELPGGQGVVHYVSNQEHKVLS
ncbi:histidine phosphatase family protein [Halovulum sp. GXIMD14793]